MKTMTLYTGGGISLSPQNAEGRRVSAYVRLVADEGKGITNGNIVTTCIDTTAPNEWHDCKLPPMPEDDEDATAEDYEAQIARFGV